MEHYDYQKRLHTVWEKAVDLYKQGQRGADSYFDEEELKFLASIGMTAQELYDFAEDYADEGIPDFATVAMIQEVRREYFFEKQNRVPSTAQLDPSTLPPKNAEVEGIVWLPRIIQKAKAKLHGELDPDTMYSCGGDRRFLRTNDIHAAEFLRQVWENEEDEQAIIDWVVKRAKSAPQPA